MVYLPTKLGSFFSGVNGYLTDGIHHFSPPVGGICLGHNLSKASWPCFFQNPRNGLYTRGLFFGPSLAENATNPHACQVELGWIRSVGPEPIVTNGVGYGAPINGRK